jgi:ATP-dependent Clp protease ATP-binding subunit ClpC
MFERYTERARRALFFARYEASLLGSTSIEPTHLLLGLLREPSGVTREVFLTAGPLDEIRDELKGHIITHAMISKSVEIPFSVSAKRVLFAASEEAIRLSHSWIGTEHLLLGILGDDSLPTHILFGRGLRLGSAREGVAKIDRAT